MSTTSSHQSSIEDNRVETKKFLLLKDSQAKSKRGAKLFDKQRVLKGSLWEEKDSPSPNHSLSSFGSSGSKGTVLSGKASVILPHTNNVRKVELHSIEYDEVRLSASENNVSELSEEQCRLLLAIPDCDERHKVHMDRDHMNTITLINVTSRVVVSTRKLSPCKGVVRWKGRIANKQGISFGVEIQDPSKFGCGDSDGTFNSVRLFKCEPNNSVFVNISNIKLIPPERPERKEKRAARGRVAPNMVLVNGSKSSDVSHTSDISSVEETGEDLDLEDHLYPITDPKVNDRVIWGGESGWEKAVVKWIGVLPDDKAEDGELLIGVEFDNAVGKGTGYYRRQKLFHAKKGHASLVPLVGLYRDTAYDILPPYTTPSPPSEFGDVGAHCPSSPPHKFVNAQSILKELAIDSKPELNTGAIYGKDIQMFVKQSEKISGQCLPSAKLLHNGNSSTKTKLASSLRSDESADSNDSLEHERAVKPASSAILSSPQKRNIKPAVGLLVPVSDHRPSSIGSISPRSCASSQGSDTHSSPSHATHSPSYHDSTHTSPNVPSLGKFTQSTKSNIIQTSPTRRKRRDQLPHSAEKKLTSVCSAVCRITPQSSPIREEYAVTIDGQPGLIKWIGYELCKPERYFAGVKMDESNGSCSFGWYGSERLVESSRSNIMFVNLLKCQILKPVKDAGDGGNKGDEINEGYIPPPTQSLIKQHVGEWKGIQGDLNSCYMDACIYAMFAFSVVFDEMLRLPKKSNDISSYSEIQNTLRCLIVNPLRTEGIVMKLATHQLRKLLDQLGLVRGLREEEKDPEEFLNLLLVDVFRLPAPIHLSNDQTCHSFHLMSEKDARIAFPTVQELLENSCAQAQLKFKQTPTYLILHMPRFSKDYRMYDKILPSIDLDLTDITEGASRLCYVCGEEAIWECPECYAAENEWKKSTFCHECSNTVHKHEKRSGHMPIDVKLFYDSGGGSRATVKAPIMLSLFAVLCIDTSHYVTFTRSSGKCATSSKWLLFDSMAKRLDDVYVPKVIEVEDLTFWLSREGFANIAKDFDSVPPKVKRLVRDGYICFYCKPEAFAC